MYIFVIAAGVALTLFTIRIAGLIEKRAGGYGRKPEISMRFTAFVFVLLLSTGMYLAYKKAAYESLLLLYVLLVTAVLSSYQDLKYGEIEDEIQLAALTAGGIALIIKGFIPLYSFFGLLFGGGILLLISILSKGGMGGADIKLNAVYGAILGFKMSLLSLLIAFILGSLTSLFLMFF